MKSLIVANWKCNPTSLKEAKQLFNSIKKGIKNIKNTEVVICPSFLTFVSSIIRPFKKWLTFCLLLPLALIISKVCGQDWHYPLPAAVSITQLFLRIK